MSEIDDIAEGIRRLLGSGWSIGAVETQYGPSTEWPPDALGLPNIPQLVRVFEGEDSGTTDTGRFNLSQGNGNEHGTLASAFGWGTVLPADFETRFVTLGARINGGNGSQYQLTRSVGGAANALAGPVLTLPGGTLAQVYPVTVAFAAGDVLNIWTVEGGATDCVGCVWGVWT